jgi:2-oxoglutarate ferredoxin oxidoreductase subunit beta
MNKVNTWEWYGKRVYRIGDDHDPRDRMEAFARALEWGDRIPVGVIYRNDRPGFEKRLPVISGGPLVDARGGWQELKEKLSASLKEFY